MKTFVFVENAEITYHILADSEKNAWEKISQLQLYNNLPDACIDVKECFLEEIIEKDKI